MKTIRFGSLQKLIAILIVAIVIVMVVGVAVSGLNEETDTPKDSNNDTNNGSNETQNENSTGDLPPEPEIPDFINYISGLEISEEGFTTKAYAFVISSMAPFYGLGNADLVIEIPCENGDTRLLAYTGSIDDLGKIGAMMPTRDYITSLSTAFGGILVSYGNDDIVNYSYGYNSAPTLDISSSNSYYYTENGRYIFSSSKMISGLTDAEGILTTALKNPNMPYTFADFGTEVKGHGKANTIVIEYADKSASKLVYSSESKKYSFYKGDTAKNDMLTGDAVDFTNVFVLFADTTTYDKSTGVETVTDTLSRGSGYYATGGTFIEIRWSTNERGELIFEDLDGNKLTVNRGSSYIGYYKSSGYDNVRLY